MPNYDEKTGIHYGAISQNSLMLEYMDNWYNNDAVYDNLKKEIIEGIKGVLQDQLSDEDITEIIDLAIDKFNDNFQNDEPHFYYEDNEYSAEYSHSLNCWIILKSPYYTFCRPCSPCVPGAGDLDNPSKIDNRFKDKSDPGFTNGIQTYCLPKDFFDPQYQKIPYRYYNVSDDKECIADIIEVD